MADELHPNCVRVMDDIASARALAEWLTEKGFAAAVWLPDVVASTGDSLGLSPETVKGYEVRVAKEADAAPAGQAIDDLKEEVAARMDKVKKRAERTGTAVAVCEECGKSSDWPASAMGSTETCPHCESYLDVPDPDENWDDVDVGEPEEPDEPEEKA